MIFWCVPPQNRPSHSVRDAPGMAFVISRSSVTTSPRTSGGRRATCSSGVVGERSKPASEGPHSVAPRVVLDLGQPQHLEDRGHIVSDTTPEALLQPVPTTDRVVRGAGPMLDGAFPRRLLFVGATEFDPIASLAEHAMEIVDDRQVVMEHAPAHGPDQDRGCPGL